jgi:hypothetical protein
MFTFKPIPHFSPKLCEIIYFFTSDVLIQMISRDTSYKSVQTICGILIGLIPGLPTTICHCSLLLLWFYHFLYLTALLISYIKISARYLFILPNESLLNRRYFVIRNTFKISFGQLIILKITSLFFCKLTIV